LAYYASPHVPALATAARERANMCLLKFLDANVRNRHMHRAYNRAAEEFLVLSASVGLSSIVTAEPVDVSAASPHEKSCGRWLGRD
jgi:hypothetical protein